MFFSVRELAVKEVNFREHYPPEAIELGPDLRHYLPLETSGRAEVVEERAGHKQVVQDIRLVGSLSTAIEARCARCLEPVKREVSSSFDLLFRPLGADRGRGQESSLCQAETEIGYYVKNGVMLEDVLKEQVLLVLPVKTVCREECRGLCPHCGRNLNVEPCSCSQQVEDARWRGLRELRDKLKES